MSKIRYAGERTMYDTLSLGRNEPCPCGSGVKFKKCCLGKPYTPSKELLDDLELGQQRIREAGIPTYLPAPKKTFRNSSMMLGLTLAAVGFAGEMKIR